MCRGHSLKGMSAHLQVVPSSKTHTVELSDAVSVARFLVNRPEMRFSGATGLEGYGDTQKGDKLSLIHISEPTRPY